MVIMTKQAVLFLDRKTGREFRAPNGYIGNCPDWVTETRQFKEMVADGKIVASSTSKDKDLAAADKKAEKKAKGSKGSKKTDAAHEAAGDSLEDGEAGPNSKPEVPEEKTEE